MKTKHSINMAGMKDTCCNRQTYPEDTCRALNDNDMPAECGPECPFYKPIGCSDWIRIEDSDGVNLIPPEEYRKARDGWQIDSKRPKYFRIK